MKKQILFLCLLVSSIHPMAQEATKVYVNAAKPNDIILELPPTPPEDKDKKKHEKKLVHFNNAPEQPANPVRRRPNNKVKLALIAASASVISSIATALITYKASKCS
jgi:hypothetical protein